MRAAGTDGGWLPFRNLFPENLVQACFQQVQTIYVPRKESIVLSSMAIENNSLFNSSDMGLMNDTKGMVRSLEFKNGMNVLGRRPDLR